MGLLFPLHHFYLFLLVQEKQKQVRTQRVLKNFKYDNSAHIPMDCFIFTSCQDPQVWNAVFYLC